MPSPHRSARLPQTNHRPATPFPTESAPFDSVARAESTILLVDDDPAVRKGLSRVLQSEGWKVISAAGGEEALEYLLTHQPDLMITDLSMAAVSGWDLLFHENLQRPDLPVFVITALPLTAVGGADKFAHEFFQKPLDLDALLTAVRRYLGAPRSVNAW